MKRLLLAITLLSSLLLSALLGCDKADSTITGADTAKTTTPPAVSSPQTAPETANSPALFTALTVDGEGTLYYDRYLTDNGIPHSAVFAPTSGNKEYYSYNPETKSWLKLPERSYRGDLLWGTFIENGKYVNYNGGFPSGEGDSTLWDIVYMDNSNECSLPANFITVDEVEILTVFKVEFFLDLYESEYSPDKPEDRLAFLEEQEAYFESMGFDILRDHRYARQREDVDIMDAELLIAGTAKQAEAVVQDTTEKRTSDISHVYYSIAVASYEHYAPEEFVDADPALILPKE